MRKIFLFIIILSLTGCSAKRNQPIEDYLTNYEPKREDAFYNEKIKDSVIWIGKEKLPRSRVIKIVKTTSPENSNLYSIPDLNELNSLYETDTITGYWADSHFNIRIKLFSHKESFKTKTVISDSGREKVYYLSEVLYFNNKKYAAFEIITTDNYIFGSDTSNDAVIFMKKEGNKWVVIHTIYDDPFSEP